MLQKVFHGNKYSVSCLVTAAVCIDDAFNQLASLDY